MRAETIAALDRINRHFYSTSGEDFSATRQAPWPTWDRVLDRFVAARSDQHATHSILDVGCGNGRFASHLGDYSGAGWSYFGLDSSLCLTAIARGNGPAGDAISGRHIVAADVVNRALPFQARSRHFDLITAFGVFHHIPSWERRRSLLVELAGHLSRDGMLAVSFWQFGSEARFSSRFVEWEEHNREASEMLDVDDLERGDHLLRWGGGESVRYCHFVDPVEAAELTAVSGLRRLETFRGDGGGGQLNLYHLLQNG